MSELDVLDAAAQEAAARPPREPFALLLWAMNAAGTLLIAAMMVLIVADVIGRSFLNAPIDGVAEICAKAIVAIVFLQLPAAVHGGRMTRADMFLARLQGARPRAAAALEAVFCAAAIFVFAVIIRATWPQFQDAWQSAEFFGVQGVWTLPTWPVRGAILLGCAGALAASAVQLVLSLRQAARA